MGLRLEGREMSWAIGYDESWQRDIGYGVPAWCDHPECNEVIDRGLSYVCGGEPYGGDTGCGLYFCGKHLDGLKHCDICASGDEDLPHYPPKPDRPEWIGHKATDPSWAEWRKAQAASEQKG